MNKLKIFIGSTIGILSLGITKLVSAAAMSTSTLEASITALNGSIMDYINIVIAAYWPFLLGLIILVAVWAFGKRIVQHFL